MFLFQAHAICPLDDADLQLCDMLQTFTGAAKPEDLAPAPPDRVWYRCCYNLISVYHNTQSFPILRSVLNLALAVSPVDASGTYSKISADLRMLRAQVCFSAESCSC